MGRSQDSERIIVDLNGHHELDVKRLNDNKELGSVAVNSKHTGYIKWKDREAFIKAMKDAYNYFEDFKT